MDKEAVFSADLNGKLTDCLKKRLRLNIADRSADFDKANIGTGVGIFYELIFLFRL